MTERQGTVGGDGSRRIGDQEREAATAALMVHREAGRLDPEEYEDRQVQVLRARTWAEIQPLFGDLPQPHPDGMPPAASGPRPFAAPGADVSPPVPGPVVGQGQPSGLLGNVVPERYRSTVMALTPFVALLLFFLTPGRGWMWFLAIPIMGILLYGPDGNERRRHEERMARDERRRQRRDDRRG